jgi:hypothetical protein
MRRALGVVATLAKLGSLLTMGLMLQVVAQIDDRLRSFSSES